MTKRNNVPGTLYLLCFPAPYRWASHYLGWTERPDLLARMAEHLRGRPRWERQDGERSEGSPLVSMMCREQGITTPEALLACVVATWDRVTRHEERRMKNHGKLSRICPIHRARLGLGPYKNIRRLEKVS